MDGPFNQIYNREENEIFRVVFFPDRIYHSRYVTAARSSRYRYNINEVRQSADSMVMTGDVYLDGARVGGMLRVEHSPYRLQEVTREHGRILGPTIRAWLRLVPDQADQAAEAMVTLHHDPAISAYAVELWESLEPPPGSVHDHRVALLMGQDAPITRVPGFASILSSLDGLTQVLAAFREDEQLYPTGQPIGDPQWDNAYTRAHQEPRDPAPSSDQNTVSDNNYAVSFQRGYFIPDAAQITPVRYLNAMSDDGNPDNRPDNIIEIRWLFQRELGSDLVFFHEVTVPPGAVEGTHRHIGSEELYYVVSGTGLAYMRDGDDPNTTQYPLVDRPIKGMDPMPCRELPVKPGSVIYTKSGGIHGIRNPEDQPLKFVSFEYQTN